MTTKFTKEWIDMARRSITEPGVERYICIPVQEEMLDEIERLQARVQELEEALTKIASYESMRFRLSPYEYGVLEQIVGIAEHALRDGE